MPIYDPREQPAPGDWDRLANNYRKVWSNAFEDMSVADDLYFQTNNIWADWERMAPGRRKGRRPSLHSGRARALIDQAVNAHLPLVPTWSRIPVHDTDDSQKKADNLENGFRIAFGDAQIQSYALATRVAGKQLILHNYTQVGVRLDEDSLTKPVQKNGEDKEEFQEREWDWWSKHQTFNPLRIEVPDVGEVLMDPLDKHPGIAIRQRKMHAFELANFTESRGIRRQNDNRGKFRRAFAALFGIKNDAYEEIKIEEWWTAQWYGLRIEAGEVLVMEPNLLGIQPYAQCWNGSPIMPTQGEWDIRFWVQQSLMWQEKDTLVMLDQSNVAHHQVVQRNAWARRGAEDPTEAASNDSDDWLVGNKDDVWLENTPQLPGQSFQHKADLNDSVERNTYSSLNVGFRQPGVDTATGILVLSEAGHRLFAEAKIQLEGLFSTVGSNALRMVYRVGKEYGEEFATITNGEHSLKISDMEERFHIEAKFEQVDAVVALQERADARIDVEAGRIDEETFFEIARYSDISGIRKRRYRDLVYKDPDIVEQGVINAMREEGFREQADRRQEALDARKIERILVNERGAPLTGADGGTIQPPGAL